MSLTDRKENRFQNNKESREGMSTYEDGINRMIREADEYYWNIESESASPSSHSDSSQDLIDVPMTSTSYRIDVHNNTFHSECSSTSSSMAIPHRSHIRDDFEMERLRKENKRLNSMLYGRHSPEEETSERLTRKLNIGEENDKL